MDTTPLFSYPGFSRPDATLRRERNVASGETTARRVRISSGLFKKHTHTHIMRVFFLFMKAGNRT